jgi:tRNA nucleotidyltransferase (CCA-adding enzyme)
MLVDYFGGKEDLDLALVRVLHNFSFIDDPTRIFRALRFVNRYQFELESLTKELMEHAIEQDVIKGLSTGRLGNELSLILGEEDIAGILLDLDELELLEYFYSGLSWGEEENRLALEIPWAIKWINALEIKEKVVNWHLYLMILLKTLSKEEIRDFIFKFKFSQELISKIIFTKERVSDLVDLLNDPALEASVVYYNLFDLSIEELVYLLLMTESDEVKEWIKEYLLNLRRIELEVTGKDIIDLGYEPGPYFKEVLQAVKTEKLNGNLQSYEEEYRCLKKCLADFADEEAE